MLNCGTCTWPMALPRGGTVFCGVGSAAAAGDAASTDLAKDRLALAQALWEASIGLPRGSR